MSASVNKLHDDAMNNAEEALLLEKQGKTKDSIGLYKKAFDYEKKAALLLPIDEKNEPSRSVIFRSAASLAIRVSDFKEAEKMIVMGLSGYPPKEIAEELRDLYEQINFERHLELKGLKLIKNEIQLSLSGNSVGYWFNK